MPKRIFLCALVFLFYETAFSQAAHESTGNIPAVSTLQNGLTLFVIPDKTNALVHVEFVCRAGFSSQTSSTAGFFPLHTRLFFKSGNAEEIISAFSPEAECTADASRFKADVPPEDLQLFLEQLAQCAAFPDFNDKDIENELAQMKAESLAYSKSTAGFINSAIDSRVFHSEPWKHDSGIYPALFSGYNAKQARAILYNFVAREFYTPYNCSLFITGNITEKKALAVSQDAFKIWNPRAAGIQSRETAAPSELSAGKKFVLAADEFSPELAQIVVQYTSLSSAQADLTACSFNSESSAYKKRLPENPELSIRSADYIAAASAVKNGSARLILQALMEQPPAGKNAADQAESFLQETRDCLLLDEGEFKSAQNEILRQYTMLTGNSTALISKLAEFWTTSRFETPEDFYKSFENSVKQLQDETPQKIQEAASEEPYVFLLLNSSVYKKNKKALEENGYELVTKKNASWYTNEILKKQAKQEMLASLEQTKANESSTIEIRPADYFYFNSENSLHTAELKNGIPVTVKENPGSKTAAVFISISGGTAASPESEKNLRTILVSALAQNTGINQISSETEKTQSHIAFEIPSEELDSALMKFMNALIYGTVSPVQADLLFREEDFDRRIKNSDPGFQLKSNALAYLYRSTPFAKLFKIDEKKSDTASYQTLLLEYTKLLDASLYSITICGDVEASKATESCQQTLGVLKEQSQRKEIRAPSPSFKNKERKVQIRHIFTSDMPAESAPKESPLLVPTKEFADPAQIYFKAPEDSPWETEIFNALLDEICEEIQAQLGNKIQCTSEHSSPDISVGMIQADTLKKAGTLFEAYKEQRRKLSESLSSEETQEWVCRRIKIRWKKKALLPTQTNSGTARIIGLSKRKEEYLANYLCIENSSPADFLAALEKYFPPEPPMKVFSADSKKGF
ncbi:insulinase family protein [Treponema sp.]|uniref:M16 family metallopeptidase n=1 Tax=Treponema sp. TaxID=166 RepID=UPI003F0F4916